MCFASDSGPKPDGQFRPGDADYGISCLFAPDHSAMIAEEKRLLGDSCRSGRLARKDTNE